MRKFLKNITLLFLFSTLGLMAGSGARYFSGQPAPVVEEIAILKAKEVIAKLVEKKQLESSWKLLDAKSAEKKIFDDRPEWVVSFQNTKISDKKRQNIYIFMKLNGEFIAVNHTGY